MSRSTQDVAVDDLRLGSAFRSLRQKRGWTQERLARAAGVSPTTIGRIERGHLGSLTVDSLRRIAAALDMRVDLVGRWRAGDLDRLLNHRHSALHEEVASWFRAALPSWILAPEVSFSIYGERGVIDILAWHPARRALLVIELKTDIADVNELVGSVDRKRRLARAIVKERGWDPKTVSVWVIVAPGRTNRRRISVHRSMLRSAFPADARTMRSWLESPDGPVAALSSWPEGDGRRHGASPVPVRRVSGRAARGPRAAG